MGWIPGSPTTETTTPPSLTTAADRLRISPPHEVDHDVYLFGHVLEPLPIEVNEPLGPELGDQVPGRPAAGGDDVSPRCPRQLDGCRPHSPAGTLDQNTMSRRDPAVDEQGLPRG